MAFGKIQRSAELFKQAWGVLRGDPQLAIFPVISAASTLLVIASFVLPVVFSPALQDSFHALINARRGVENTDGASMVAAIAMTFSFYLVTSFVTIFFNAALLGAADRKFRGLPTGVVEGLHVAIGRLPQILGWAIVSAIVGTILRMIEERSGWLGRIVIALFGAAWAIASYFAIPALVIEGVGPIEALKRSVATIRKTWGESLVLAVGFGVVGFLISFAAIIVVVAGVVVGVVTQSVALGIAIGSIGVLALIAWIIVASTLRAIVQVALYRFATDGTIPQGFRQDSLQMAFARK
ncbi:MAG: DUF6159 family protein [Phycisphaerales bacterium]